MFHQKSPFRAFIRAVLRVQVDRRRVTRSAACGADERRKVLEGSSPAEIGADLSGTKFTQEQMDIHAAHTEACEVKMTPPLTSRAFMLSCSACLM